MSVQSDRVRNLMQRVSYKPGWRMTVVDFPSSVYSPWRPNYKIVLIYTVQDPNNPSTIATFTYEREWNDYDTEGRPDSFVIEMIIADTLRYAEQKEFDEWFRVDGQRFNREIMHAPSPYPHPQQPRTEQEMR